MARATQRDVPRLALEPFHRESISVRVGDERVEVGEERVEVMTPVDADRALHFKGIITFRGLFFTS